MRIIEIIISYFCEIFSEKTSEAIQYWKEMNGMSKTENLAFVLHQTFFS